MNIDEVKRRITELKNQFGDKHFSGKIKKDLELFAELMALTNQYSDDLKKFSISARAYVILNDYDPICKYGKLRVLDSINNGFGNGCGSRSDCQCAKNIRSASGIEAKKKVTPEDQAATNKKRDDYNLEHHGVANIGQTSAARQAHADFYKDPENVKAQLEEMKKTNLEIRQVDNVMKDPEVAQKVSDNWANKSEEELKEILENRKIGSQNKYGFDFPHQHPEIAQKLSDSLKRIPDDKRKKLDDYRLEVKRVTSKHARELEAKGFKFGARNFDLQIDHIVSQIQGFLDDIDPKIIGGKRNLMVTTGSYNKIKSDEYRDSTFLFEERDFVWPQIDPRIELVKNNTGNIISKNNLDTIDMMTLSSWSSMNSVNYDRAVREFDKGLIPGKIIDGSRYVKNGFIPSNIGQVECEICHVKMNNITSSHLKASHSLTVDQYLTQFPNAVMVSEITKNRLSESTTGILKTKEHKDKISKSISKAKRKKNA